MTHGASLDTTRIRQENLSLQSKDEVLREITLSKVLDYGRKIFQLGKSKPSFMATLHLMPLMPRAVLKNNKVRPISKDEQPYEKLLVMQTGETLEHK